MGRGFWLKGKIAEAITPTTPWWRPHPLRACNGVRQGYFKGSLHIYVVENNFGPSPNPALPKPSLTASNLFQPQTPALLGLTIFSKLMRFSTNV